MKTALLLAVSALILISGCGRAPGSTGGASHASAETPRVAKAPEPEHAPEADISTTPAIGADPLDTIEEDAFANEQDAPLHEQDVPAGQRDGLADERQPVEQDSTSASDSPSMIKLTASRTYSPSKWNDGVFELERATAIQIPEFIVVTSGNAGNQWAHLTLGGATCMYRGGAPRPNPTTAADLELGRSYVFSGCLDSQSTSLDLAPGDSYSAIGRVVLRLQGGAHNAGATTATVELWMLSQ